MGDEDIFDRAGNQFNLGNAFTGLYFGGKFIQYGTKVVYYTGKGTFSAVHYAYSKMTAPPSVAYTPLMTAPPEQDAMVPTAEPGIHLDGKIEMTRAEYNTLAAAAGGPTFQQQLQAMSRRQRINRLESLQDRKRARAEKMTGGSGGTGSTTENQMVATTTGGFTPDKVNANRPGPINSMTPARGYVGRNRRAIHGPSRARVLNWQGFGKTWQTPKSKKKKKYTAKKKKKGFL